MWSLSNHRWYAAALALFLGAVAAEYRAKRHAGHAITAISRAANVPAERSLLRQVADRHVQHSSRWGLTGLALAALGVGAWLTSGVRREAGPLIVPAALLCLYALLLMLFV